MMKGLLNSLTVLCLFTFSSSAQVQDNARFNLLTPGLQEWCKGWYITLDGDTVHGYIFLSNQIDNQNHFDFSKVNQGGQDQKKLDGSMAKGYRVKDRVYEALHVESNINSSLTFIRRIEHGRVSLFTWFNIPVSGGLNDAGYVRPITVTDEKFHETVYILRVGGSNAFLCPPANKFDEEMSKVFADDKELSNKIADKLRGYRRQDLISIVQEYNAWFVSRH